MQFSGILDIFHLELSAIKCLVKFSGNVEQGKSTEFPCEKYQLDLTKSLHTISIFENRGISYRTKKPII